MLCVFAALPAAAQQDTGFDDIAAADEIEEIKEIVASEDVNNAILTEARSRLVQLESQSSGCATAASSARIRLEERYEPLREVDPEVVGIQVMEQRRQIRELLNVARATEARCKSILDDTRELSRAIADKQLALSQQFLSSRTQNAVGLARDFPQRVATWPNRVREQFDLDLVENLTPVRLLWLLLIAGALAAGLGLILRHRVNASYDAAVEAQGTVSSGLLARKLLADFAPLLLEGVALLVVLYAAVVDASSELVIVRVAWSILIFGIVGLVIQWATGPLSPSATIEGLIPDHVTPLRMRLRFVVFSLLLSYTVLGDQWTSIRVSDPYVGGRAACVFLIGVSLLVLLAYLRNVPGIGERFRLLRYAAIATTAAGVAAVLIGYQNFSAYLVYGITQTCVALFVLWTLSWLVSSFLSYLTDEDSAGAEQARQVLGIRKSRSRSGVGFMQLVADLILWISFAVAMLIVWDDAGTTLGRLYEIAVGGREFGGLRLVPVNIIGGILVFVGILVLISWTKRWIDRRWLQHMAIDRGTRDAIVTLFGYVGFVVAGLIALVQSEVDLTGLAFISGALALGLGFGLQGIANNFVSGIILLFERPIRAGDFVTVGDIQGFVRSIRIRATEIETLDNQNVLVPNSELVSGRVTNWVLRDSQGRLRVEVGVAYGSDVEKVRDVLENCARQHPEVVTDGSAPAPRALFMEFGDSSLNFELRVRVKHIERRFSVLSELNFAINHAFREAGITVPFPQRDLHLVSYPDDRDSVIPPKPDSTPRPHAPSNTRSHRHTVQSSCSAEEIWEQISTIDGLNGWLSREGTLTPEPGGAFRLIGRDGYEVAGRFDVYEPPRHLRGTLIPITDEQPLPGGAIRFDLEISDVDGNRQLAVEVTGIPDSEDWEEYYRLSVDRWESALKDLRQEVLRR